MLHIVVKHSLGLHSLDQTQQESRIALLQPMFTQAATAVVRPSENTVTFSQAICYS